MSSREFSVFSPVCLKTVGAVRETLAPGWKSNLMPRIQKVWSVKFLKGQDTQPSSLSINKLNPSPLSLCSLLASCKCRSSRPTAGTCNDWNTSTYPDRRKEGYSRTVGRRGRGLRVLPAPRSYFSDRPWRRGWTCGKEHPVRRSHTQNADIAKASKQTTGNGRRHICAHHVRASSSNVNRSSAGVESMRRPLSAFRPHVKTKLDDATRSVTGIRCLQAGHSKCTDPPPPCPPSGRGSHQMGAGWRPFQPQCTTCVFRCNLLRSLL